MPNNLVVPKPIYQLDWREHILMPQLIYVKLTFVPCRDNYFSLVPMIAHPMIEVKALANSFNILSILLNGNVESVCHPLSTVLKRVETC